jgi:hypothetical protein
VNVADRLARIRAFKGFWKDIAAWLVLAAIAVVVTWPLAAHATSVLPDADDAYFSVWRLAWVAHQLREAPAALFDTNVFYPATNTLAYSDAMLLVGLLSAPFIWLGAAPVAVHNIALIAALATSAWAMYVLARRLTDDRAAAFLAATVFSAAPYRVAHIGHLELECVAWMPISLLLLHKLIEAPRARTGILLGATVAAQTLCSIYYGIFLSGFIFVAWCLLAAGSRDRKRLVAASAVAVVPLVAILGPYSIPYARAKHEQAPRSKDEIARYSAVPGDYLRVAPDNVVWGKGDSGPAPDERTLFPGAVALALAIAALWPPVRRTALFFALLGMLSFDASLGENGLLFPTLQHVIPPLASLRAPARFGILVLLTVSVLAALGAARLNRATGGRASPWIVLAALLCLGEYWSVPIRTREVSTHASPAHAWLAAQPGDVVVAELPMPNPRGLWFYETTFQFRSIYHWKRLVNGYTGFAPASYLETLELMTGFPDARSVARLRALSVDFVLVNREYYEPGAYQRLVERLIESGAFETPHAFRANTLEVLVFPLKP